MGSRAFLEIQDDVFQLKFDRSLPATGEVLAVRRELDLAERHEVKAMRVDLAWLGP